MVSGQGRAISPTGTSMSAGTFCAQRASDDVRPSRGSVPAHALGAKRLGQGHVIRIHRLGTQHVARNLLLLSAFDVAKRVIVEHHRPQPHGIATRGGQLGHGPAQPSVSRNGHDGLLGYADFRAPRAVGNPYPKVPWYPGVINVRGSYPG